MDFIFCIFDFRFNGFFAQTDRQERAQVQAVRKRVREREKVNFIFASLISVLTVFWPLRGARKSPSTGSEKESKRARET